MWQRDLPCPLRCPVTPPPSAIPTAMQQHQGAEPGLSCRSKAFPRPPSALGHGVCPPAQTEGRGRTAWPPAAVELTQPCLLSAGTASVASPLWGRMCCSPSPRVRSLLTCDRGILLLIKSIGEARHSFLCHHASLFPMKLLDAVTKIQNSGFVWRTTDDLNFATCYTA